MNHDKKVFVLLCAEIVDNMKKAMLTSWSSLSISNKSLNIFKLLYLARGIYVRFICQQESQNFSVPFFRSYIRWGSTVLHTKLKWTMLNNSSCFHVQKSLIIWKKQCQNLEVRCRTIINVWLLFNCCTFLAAFMSALFASRSDRVSVCPFWEAINAGVAPVCIQN